MNNGIIHIFAKVALLLVCIICCKGTLSAQTDQSELLVSFDVSSVNVNELATDTAANVRQLIVRLKEVEADSSTTILAVTFVGTASPEGSTETNIKLAQERRSQVERLVRSVINIPDSIIIRDDNYIKWDYLIQLVEDSDLQAKRQVIDILMREPQEVPYLNDQHIDNRVLLLQQLDGGRVWQQLKSRFFPSMRSANAIFTVQKREALVRVAPGTIAETPTAVSGLTVNVEASPIDTIIPAPADTVVVPADNWVRHLSLKTNAVAWGLGITNIAVEVDLVKHWSFTLPAGYSAWNYFKQTVKFRTSYFQPEVRYWVNENNDGWFVGAHFGLAWYNYAGNGEYRYQDHGAHSPAVGGGIAAGYRLPVSKNGHWKLEFSVGAGVYGLHYDKFVNVKNGALVATARKTWFGIDQAAVSVVYSFDLGKKGGAE